MALLNSTGSDYMIITINLITMETHETNYLFYYLFGDLTVNLNRYHTTLIGPEF
jgi:hypothetical protein